MLKKIVLISLAVCLLHSARLYSAPAFNGDPGPKEYANIKGRISASDYDAQATVTKKIAVILVDFPSAGSSTSGTYTMNATDISNLDVWFGTNTLNKTFPNYYDEASYGQLNLDIIFAVTSGLKSSLSGVPATQCFTMPQSMSYYGYGEDGNKLAELVTKAIETADSGGVHIDTATYHYVMVAHAGYGNESTYSSNPAESKPGDIWSVSVGPFSNTNGFTTGAIVPAREAGSLEPLGVICHEFGHQLGLPDIYAPTTGANRVGVYALMDSGSWNDKGTVPAHFCSWSKAYLNWLTPTLGSGNMTGKVLNPLYNTNISSVYKFNVEGTASEYFLLSYRKQFGYDAGVSNSGTAIEWGPVILHIDDSVGTVSENDVNDSNQIHPRVAIVGVYDNDMTSWDVDRVFTSPYSDSYSGSVSGITIYDFAVGASAMTFNATAATFANTISFLAKPQNYPNPATGTSTTLTFRLTKAEADREIRIYTPSGELVKKVDSDEINAYFVQDNEIVYRYIWDLTNDDGDEVASGIYLYHVLAGDKSEIGRMTYIKP